MINQEESSSNAIYNEDYVSPSEIIEEEIEPTYSVEYVNAQLLQNIQDTVQNLLGCIGKVNENSEFSPIYMAPSRLRELSPGSFTPRVVSIGPLHKQDKNLQAMELKKTTYLDELLRHVGSPRETLTNCVRKVHDSIGKIRGSYVGMKAYTDVQLAQMMVMDGCFILQFISKLSTSGNFLSDNRLRSRSIALDLVLLENQIPFFVLQDIYEFTLKKLKSSSSLTDMLTTLLGHVNPFVDDLRANNLGTEVNHFHILGLLQILYLPDHTHPSTISILPRAHSVVELDNIGVKFKPNQNMTWAMAMDFKSSRFTFFSFTSHRRTLRMPVVRIDNFTEVVLRNLIVYEQHSPVYNYVTSYAMAMNMLVDTPADIAKLVESKVIVNYLGSNEKASDMIDNICKDVTFLDFYYIEQWQSLDSYYDNYWSKNIAVLKRTYFSTPWKAIALLAGIMLFVITLLQAIFHIMHK